MASLSSTRSLGLKLRVEHLYVGVTSVGKVSDASQPRYRRHLFGVATDGELAGERGWAMGRPSPSSTAGTPPASSGTPTASWRTAHSRRTSGTRR